VAEEGCNPSYNWINIDWTLEGGRNIMIQDVSINDKELEACNRKGNMQVDLALRRVDSIKSKGWMESLATTWKWRLGDE
jgi:hypothetical protein